MAITESDKAYLAGLFDGEGCIGYYNANPNPNDTPYCHASLVVTMTDEAVIRWLHKTLECGHVSIAKKKGQNRRTAYQWQASKKAQVRQVLNAIRPYLRVKAAQADALLELFKDESRYVQRHGSVSEEVAARRLAAVQTIRALKRAACVEGVET